MLTVMLATFVHAALVAVGLCRTGPVPVKTLLKRKDILINSANKSMNCAKPFVTSVVTKSSSKRYVTV